MSSNSTSPSTLRASPFDEVIAEFRRLPRADWLDQVMIDQSHRWRGRAGVSAEEYFRCLPEMREDEETVLVVINGEMMLRTEMGETGILDEFRRRFPELADRITVQYELSSALAR